MTLIVLSLLFAGGLVARYVQQRTDPIAEDAYAESDRLFFERSEMGADSTDGVSAPADSASSLLVDASGSRNAARAVRGGGAVGRDPSSAGLAGGVARNDSDLRDSRIDLNSASSQELQQLPRIGPKTAERIIEFRATYGPFRSVDDLVQVRGIGPKTLERLRPLVRAELSSSRP